MAVETEPHAKRSRTRSPSYPYLGLPSALEKAAALWNVEGRHPVSVAVAMQHWGYKEESSTGYSCVAALKKFGLVDHDGMGETRQIRLSALALGILLDRDPASAERRDAVRRAALNPRIHAELWERYGADLPSDQTLRRFLVIERNFNEGSVDELLAEYKETAAFAGLLGRGAAMTTTANGIGHGAGDSVPARVDTILPAFAPPSPEAPRGVQNARERAGDGAEGSWQGRGAATAPAVRHGLSAGNGTGHGFGPDRALATNSLAPASPVSPAGAGTVPPGANGQGQDPGLRGSNAQGRGRQADFFGQHEDHFDASVVDELPPPLPAHRAAPSADLPADRQGVSAAAGAAGVPARRELPVPLDNGLVARVPYPMSEEDFSLLMDTLQLWKKRLVRD